MSTSLAPGVLAQDPAAPASSFIDLVSLRRCRRIAFVIAALTALLLACTIPATEICTSVEALNVATAMEIRRGGDPSAPTLDGEPRIRKPPLTLWITTAAIRGSTMAKLDNPSEAVRRAGYLELLFETRLPSALMTAASVLVLYEMAALLVGARHAIWASVMGATSLLVVFHARLAILDVQLLLWTGLASLAFVNILLRGPRVIWTLVAGVALGLGILTKGPVALLLTWAPACCVALYKPSRRTWAALAGAFGVSLAVSLPWFAYVVFRHQGAMGVWWTDITRSDPAESPKTTWLSYWRVLPTFFPWGVMLAVGLIFITRELAGWWRARAAIGVSADERRRLLVLALWIVVPLVVMSCFRDRKVRYALPLAPILAVVAAQGLAVIGSDRLGRALRVLHWTAFGAGLGIACLALGTTRVVELLTLDGNAQLSLPVAVAATALLVGGCSVAAMLSRESKPRLVFLTGGGLAIVILCALPILRKTDEANADMRPIAEYIEREIPGAVVYRVDEKGGPTRGLSVYLNRSRKNARTFDTIIPRPYPQVVVTNRADPVTPTQPGWHLAKTIRVRNLRYEIYYLPPAN